MGKVLEFKPKRSVVTPEFVEPPPPEPTSSSVGLPEPPFNEGGLDVEGADPSPAEFIRELFTDADLEAIKAELDSLFDPQDEDTSDTLGDI